MAFEIIWSSMARYDFWDLIAYTANSSPTVGSNFVQKLLEAVEHLRDFPETGSTVTEFSDSNIREIIRKLYRIIYRLKHNEKRLYFPIYGTLQGDFLKCNADEFSCSILSQPV